MNAPTHFAAILVGTTMLAAGMPASAETAAELIAKGDVHYERLEPSRALEYYLPAEKLEPQNASLLVKISRQYRHLMSEARRKDDKIKYARIGVEYANRAVDLAPSDSEAQLAVAISYGKLIPMVGNKEAMEGSKTIKSAAEKALALDPKNDLAWHILGRWHLNIADIGAVKRTLANIVYGKLPKGTNEQAEACFEKAIALNPRRLMHYIELGRTYVQMGRKDEARKFIQKGLAMRNTEKDDPETKDKGRELIAKLK